MINDGEALARRLEAFRGYLWLLASARIDPRLRGRLDPADMVQQTLVRALEKRDQFRGQTDAQRAAWLRTILARAMIDEARKHGLTKGGSGHERSLQVALDESSARLEALLMAEQTTPSQRLMQQERLQRLGEVLACLPDDQRRAIELRHLQGQKIAEIARQMNRTPASVAGLLQRGLRALRRVMDDT